MKKIYTIAAVTVLLAACASHQERLNEYCGTFEGVSTAANGEQVLTTLQLNKDNSFNSIMQYSNQPTSIFTEQGSYTISGNTIKIDPFNGDPAYYQIEKKQLRRLDSQKHLTVSPLAKNYVLKRTACCK